MLTVEKVSSKYYLFKWKLLDIIIFFVIGIENFEQTHLKHIFNYNNTTYIFVYLIDNLIQKTYLMSSYFCDMQIARLSQ